MPVSQDRATPVQRAVDPAGVHRLAEDRPGEQPAEQEAVDRLVVRLGCDVTAGHAPLEHPVDGRPVRIEDAGPERLEQPGVATLLGEQ